MGSHTRDTGNSFTVFWSNRPIFAFKIHSADDADRNIPMVIGADMVTGSVKIDWIGKIK